MKITQNLFTLCIQFRTKNFELIFLIIVQLEFIKTYDIKFKFEKIFLLLIILKAAGSNIVYNFDLTYLICPERLKYGVL